MCSGEVRSSLRLPRHSYIQPNVIFGLPFLSGESSDRFSSKNTTPMSLSRRSTRWKSLRTSKRSLSPCIYLMTNFWIQQDGVSSHTSNMSREWIKKNFGKRVISLKTDFEWTPHIPDLSTPDFFLWDYLKDKVYASKPRTTSELKSNIREKIRAIPRSVCKDIMLNLTMRLKKCTEK